MRAKGARLKQKKEIHSFRNNSHLKVFELNPNFRIPWKIDFDWGVFLLLDPIGVCRSSFSLGFYLRRNSPSSFVNFN